MAVRAGTDKFIYLQSGIIYVPADGVMGFATASDDGSRLYVGNWWETGATLTEVVQNDGWHGMDYRSASIPVTAGYVGIIVKMFEGGGGEGLEVYYYSDTMRLKQIPVEALLSRFVANNPSPARNAVGVAVGTALSWTKPVFKDGVTNILMFAESLNRWLRSYRGTGTTFTPTLAVDKAYLARGYDRAQSQRAQSHHHQGPRSGDSARRRRRLLPKRLLAYWPLDADLSDASGNGLITGKYFSNDSSAPVFEPGMKGNALAINIADTTNAQYAKLADWSDPTLSTVGVNAAMPRTMACWVKNAVVPAGTIADWCTCSASPVCLCPAVSGLVGLALTSTRAAAKNILHPSVWR